MTRNLQDRLRSAIAAAGLTQAQLADLVETTQPAVSQWVTGKKIPTDENLEQIARALGVRPEWLSQGTPPMRVQDEAADRGDYVAHAGWAFRPSPRDGGRDFGNANVWSFDPSLDVLVREVLQNAKDAALSPDRRVDVTFRVIRLTGLDFSEFREAAQWTQLRTHLDASKEGKQKFNTLLRDGLQQLDRQDELLLLVIEDNGTTGLTGPERGSGNFTALCRNNLDSNKDGSSGGAGGAFGLGKAVLWRASRLSTVLFCSHLSRQEEGFSQYRIFGRCELAWHSAGGNEYAGPGWFGRLDPEGDAATSYWQNQTLAEALYLGREGVGTSTCVVGFHDASADAERSPVDLAQDIARSAAENFFPAIVSDRLSVRVEVYDSGRQFRERSPSFSQAVNPDAYVPVAARMLRALREDATVERLGDGKDAVVMREVVLTVPRRTDLYKHGEQEHRALLLLSACEDDEPLAGDKVNHLTMFRGAGMVVLQRSLTGLCLGARPFHALLLCGRAVDTVHPDALRMSPEADAAAEMFLRTAEPPSHNQWTATPDLKAVYARGCKSRLEAFLREVVEAVRELVKPPPKDTGDGPNALKELFRIGTEPGPRAEQPRVVEQRGTVDSEGRWQVSARIRLKARKTRQRLVPAVYFLAETGTGAAVPWESLIADRGCDVDGTSLLIPPDTREVRFRGTTDARFHPIPASDSCIVVDIKKLANDAGGGS